MAIEIGHLQVYGMLSLANQEYPTVSDFYFRTLFINCIKKEQVICQYYSNQMYFAFTGRCLEMFPI